MYFSTLCLATALLARFGVEACSRVTYNAGVDDRFVIGRSMDFVASTNASIYTFPAGLQRNGSVGANSLQWTSKYGSMVTAMYDSVAIDGINTEALTGSVLYLGPSDYGQRNASRPGVAIGFWLQYFLDMYSTVDEAATALQKMDIQVVTATLVPGVSSVGHISLSDKSGDNLILEYLDGKLVMHQGKQYPVMTNDPTFDEQLAIAAYWKPMSNYSLPGTGTPSDRFVRLSYYNGLVPQSGDLVTAVATTAGMIRAVSVPFVPESQINKGLDVWPTLWRVYYDVKDMMFFYESAVAPISIYMSLGDYDLSSKGKVQRLDLADADWEDRYGDMKGKFVESKPFAPVGGV
ncbi:uncharacterized protein A1O9_00287 [Exophiala aquamarina CBS 119918]|uniref:Choloylglycine hydrolase/NAAA C-terminal domain-containing protein n=1 Tax=Exophiala aquamarina CBS 119918 TaxID=1182545 RepID=A0A072Q359_9EURO|nr:uncharacterized protein A1O9_00287 [Exophiala aquamarina CBS 119918]KEF62315.1 hypothetical protein A1O9_00287 [Exophiala aquamarina CBS 119918]